MMAQESVPTQTTNAFVTAGHQAADTEWTQEAHVFAGLTLRVYDMPTAIDQYIQPLQPELSVGVLMRGAMRLGVRQAAHHWSEQHVHKGDLFLRPPYGEPRELRWRTEGAENTHMLNLYLHHELLIQVVEAVAERDPARVEFVEHNGFQDPLLLQLGLALYDELLDPTPTSSVYAETAGHMLAVHLLRHYTTDVRVPEPHGGLTPRQVQRVYAFVREHLAHDLSLSLLAEQVNLSPYHFARLFRQATAESPHQFVLRQRLEQVQLLLETTDTPLVEIAVASGFTSQSYLTTVFKQRLGLTPRAYRRRVQ